MMLTYKHTKDIPVFRFILLPVVNFYTIKRGIEKGEVLNIFLSKNIHSF